MALGGFDNLAFDSGFQLGTTAVPVTSALSASEVFTYGSLDIDSENSGLITGF